nr:monooxygenase, FAD-binding [Kibdelosporangium sp. MJ126-NF4]CTQ95363.1 monooxygenase, FAD-binding [Kibdelosporangium sp. MJ126-NF4]
MLVVGAGPVGLCTAMFLAHWGVSSVVIDKRDPTTAPPRAATSMRTLELFRSVGLWDSIDRNAWKTSAPMAGVFKDSAFGEAQRVAGLPRRHTERLATCSPVGPGIGMTQSEVQQIALEQLSTTNAVRFGAELLDLDMDETTVRARIVDSATGEPEEIVADYLIAADGANSRVRGLLGITVPDRVVVARMNTAFFRADLGDIMDKWGTTACFVRNERVYATLFSKNGADQWSSHIMDYAGKPDELTDLSHDKTVELLHAVIGDDRIDIDLHAVNAWEAALGVASKLRQGRVFLVGDAAHVQSSAGGLGMNTGIQDGHNLAWKIAAVLAGNAAPPLLDTYEPERMAAVEASLALSRRMHEGYLNRVDPDQLYDAIAADYLRGMLFYSYQPDSPNEVMRDEIRPGRRFPHHWVKPDLSTLDLIGSRWTVLTGAGGASWLAAADELEMDVQAFEVPDVISPDDAVLVRPDGFVGWRADGASPAALSGAIRRLLGHASR